MPLRSPVNKRSALRPSSCFTTRKVKLIPFSLAFIGFALAAQADTITEYFDQASFDAAVAGPLTVEDFTSTSHFPISTGVLNTFTDLPGIGIYPGDILPGVTYSTNVDSNSASSNEFNIDGGGSGFTGGFLDSLNIGSNRPLTVAFDIPVEAFGFDTNGSVGGTSQIIQIGDTLLTLSLPDSDTEFFFGFVSSLVDISGATLTSNGSSDGDAYGFAVDNFAFSAQTASSTPEASTFVLLLIGLGGILYFGPNAVRRNPEPATGRSFGMDLR